MPNGGGISQVGMGGGEPYYLNTGDPVYPYPKKKRKIKHMKKKKKKLNKELRRIVSKVKSNPKITLCNDFTGQRSYKHSD